MQVRPRVQGTDLAQLPRAVAQLVIHLRKHASGDLPFLLHELPQHLRREEVLQVALDHHLVRVLVWAGTPETARWPGMSVRCWRPFNWVGFAKTLAEGLAKNSRIEIDQHRLHISLTPDGQSSANEHILRLEDEPPPTDLITLMIAAARYHISRKGLLEAINHQTNPLRNHRPAGAARNAPMLVSERDVANRWSKRAQ